MLEYIKIVIAFLEEHPYVAYELVFLAAVIEALPLVGTVIPGSTIVIAISALAPTGIVAFWPLMFWAVLGAVIGDATSYFLGGRYKRKILEWWPFCRYPQLAARSETFFRRHGGKSVVLGRFTPALRPFVPLFAGILGMPAGRFYVANILSALLWAPAHIIPGIALGATLGLAAAVAGRLVALVLVVLLLLWAITWSVSQALRMSGPRLTALRGVLLDWARSHESLLSRQILSMLDPARNEFFGLAAAAAVLVGSIWLFLGILEEVVTGDPLVRVDAGVLAILQGLRSPFGDKVMILITELGDTAVVIPVAVAAAMWLVFRRAWRTAAYWAGAIALASLFNSVIKVALSRPRPLDGLYAGVGSFSFPSGHATVNTAMYGFLGFLVVRKLRPAVGIPVAAIIACLVAMIAFSRLYLGAHWFSDVAAGLAFGVAWITLLGFAYHYHRPEEISPRGLLVVVGIALSLAGATNIYRAHASDVLRYVVRKEVHTMTAADWLGSGWQQLPTRRTDLIGEFEGPLTVQWAGRLDVLQARLQADGWLLTRPLTLSGALSWISPEPDSGQMPTLPLLHDGLAPALAMILPQSAESRLVLNVWPTSTLVGGGPSPAQPLWIGAVVEERLERPVWPITISVAQDDLNGPRDHLAASFGNGRLEPRPGVTRNPSWDGRVLLIHAPGLW